MNFEQLFIGVMLLIGISIFLPLLIDAIDPLVTPLKPLLYALVVTLIGLVFGLYAKWIGE